MGSVEQTGTIQLSMQFSQDGRQLRTWYRKKMSLWSVADQALIGERHVETSPNLMFATSNRHWSIGIHNRNQIELRDVHTGRLARTWYRPPGTITSVAFSPDTTKMAVSTASVPATLYDFYRRPEKLSEKPHEELIESLGDEDPAVAFDSMCELIHRGDKRVPDIRSALKGTILPKKQFDILPSNLTAYRSIEVLAAIGTPAASELLKELAKPHDDPVAIEARATLGITEKILP